MMTSQRHQSFQLTLVSHVLLALYFYIFMTVLQIIILATGHIRQQLNSFDSLRRLVLCGHVIHVVDFSNCTAVENCSDIL